MKQALNLTRVLIRNSYGFGRKEILIGLLVLVCFLPAGFQLYGAYSLFIQMHLPAQSLDLAFFVSCLLGSFTVLLSFPTVFYFAKDNRYLLALPLKPWQILFAKFAMIYLSQVVLDVLFLVPLWIAWVQMPFSLTSWIFLILSSFGIVFIPLFLIGIFYLLVMRFMPFFGNRDRFNLIISLFALVLFLGIGFVSGYVSTGSHVVEESVAGMDFSALPLRPVFFQIPLVIDAVLNQNWIAFGLFILISILCALAFFVMAGWLYVPALVNISQKSSRVRTRTKARSADFSYLVVEFKKLIRSPSYLTNLVLGALILPVSMCVILWLLFTGDEVIIPQMFLRTWGSDPAILLLIGLASGLFLSSPVGISATAISREGAALPFLKSLPVPMERQIVLKMLLGIGITLLGALPLLALPALLSATPLGWIVYIVAIVVSVFFCNWISILIDCYHPKLIWDDETAAIKNNLNSIFALFFAWLALGLSVGIIFLFGLENYGTSAWVLLALFLGLDILFYFLVPKWGVHFLQNKN